MPMSSYAFIGPCIYLCIHLFKEIIRQKNFKHTHNEQNQAPICKHQKGLISQNKMNLSKLFLVECMDMLKNLSWHLVPTIAYQMLLSVQISSCLAWSNDRAQCLQLCHELKTWSIVLSLELVWDAPKVFDLLSLHISYFH